MTQHITLHEVKQACKAALANDTLLALHPEAMLVPAYEVGQFRCAIGAALSAETLSEIRNSTKGAGCVKSFEYAGIGELEYAGIISYAPREEKALRRLQVLHDWWFTKQDDESEQNFFDALEND